ncbi:hypothetical protein NADFUDRAFT_51438 [Nadsonia fulvescens var. elongata DSM 6958]|uniref:Uncharacterized protein n=1 Tax=Nadsonia fulvescens var. elongata DSM 6958 TaxID=857566 RepID=A0A1E3PL67_9ASCO|nr:hypothetical protein NADFUDRAFT_51438 [Nadsonia fulvescens var. elongata DSM 6958]
MDYGYSYHYDGSHGSVPHASTQTTRGSISGPAQGSHGHTKKDKRRQSIAFKLNHITELFENERDFHYREMLHALQSTLSSLHAGTNDQFLETLTDIQENRDQELVRLSVWESYQIASCQREYDQDTHQAHDEYEAMTQMVKDRLVRRIEGQKKSLREDKALLDMANDHNFLLNGSYGMGQDRYYHQQHLTRSNYGNGQYRDNLNGALSAGAGAGAGTTGNGPGGSNVMNNNGNLSDSKAMGSVTPGSPGAGYGLGDRRSLRNRRNNPNTGGMNSNNNESLSGLDESAYSASGIGSSGVMNNNTNYSGNTNYSISSKRRKAASGYRSGNDDGPGDSKSTNVAPAMAGSGAGGISGNDDNNPIWSDGFEGLLFAKERDIPTTTPRHNSRSYQGVPTLKPDEATEDLNVLRAAISTFRGPAYNLGAGGPNGGSTSGQSTGVNGTASSQPQQLNQSQGGGGSRRRR